MKKQIKAKIFLMEIIMILLIATVISASPVYAYELHEGPLAMYSDDEIFAEYYYSSDMFRKYLRESPYYPYQQYIKEMEKEDGFSGAYALWRGANFAEKLINGDQEGALEEAVNIEYYEIVLYDLIFGFSDTDAFFSDVKSIYDTAQIKATKSLINAYHAEFGDDYDIGLDVSENKETWDLVLSSAYVQDKATYESAFATVDVLKSIADDGATLEKVVNRIATILAFNNMREGYTAMLNIMADECENIPLKLSIYDFCQYFNNNFSTEYIISREIFEKAFKESVQELNKDVFKEMASKLGLRISIPELVYKTGKLLLNTWLSVDQKYETYAKMTALSDIEYASGLAAIKCVSNYKEQLTLTNAQALNACVDFGVRIGSLGYEYSENYYSVLDESGLNSVMQSLGYYSLDYSDIKNNFKEERARMEKDYKLSKVMIAELISQGREGYNAKFGNYYELNSLQDFDSICTISKEISRRDPDSQSHLAVKYDGSITIDGDLELGRLNVTYLTVNNGNVNLHGGSSISVINVNNARVNIDGNLGASSVNFSKGQLIIKGDAYLRGIGKMNDDSDLFRVEGDLTVGCASDFCDMTAGRVELLKNLNVKNRDRPTFAGESMGTVHGYEPTGTCTTVFCGDEMQTVLGFYYNDDCRLGLVDIQNSKFTMDLDCITYESEPVMILAADAVITEGGNIDCYYLDLNGHSLDTVGTVCVYDGVYATDKDASIKASMISSISNSIVAKNCKLTVTADITAQSVAAYNAEMDIYGKSKLSYNIVSSNGIVRFKGDVNLNNELQNSANPGIIELWGSNNEINRTNGSVASKTIVLCGDQHQTFQTWGGFDAFVVNAHQNESDVNIMSSISNDRYIWDPDYKSSNIYLKFCNIPWESNYYYCWDNIEPEVSITFVNKVISPDMYSVEYSNNYDIGTAHAVITGKGNLIGSRDLSFSINKIPLSKVKIEPIDDVRITKEEIGQQAFTPGIYLCYDDHYWLDEPIDFTVRCKNNTKPGVATAEITGKGIFTGYKTVHFNIVEYVPVYSHLTVENGIAEEYYLESPYETRLWAVPPEDGAQFIRWELVSGDGRLIFADKPDAYFAFGESDSVIRAVFKLRDIDSIEVDPPLKKDYIAGEEFDASGMVVYAVYDTGEKKAVIDYTVTGFGDSEETNEITVECRGKTATFSVIIHTPEAEWAVTQAPTCTEGGSQELHCADCGKILKTETLNALEHDWGEWETVCAPNCTDKGSQKRVCGRCSTEELKEVDPNGHTWEEEYVLDLAPTCTAEGSESRHCSKCGVSNPESVHAIDKRPHSYGDWTTTKEPTCTEPGSREKKCTECDDVVVEELSALGHSYDEVEGTAHAATCTEPGRTADLVCSACGDKKDGTVTDALGHDYSEWYFVTEPTCTESGVREKTCKVCGSAVSEPVSAAGHSWEDDFTVDLEPSCTEEGSRSIHCTKCKEVRDIIAIPANGHSFGEWVVIEQNTCTNEGLQQHSCEVCGFTESENFDPAGHDWEEGYSVDVEATCIDDGSQSIHCRKCDAVMDSMVIPAPGHSWNEKYTVDKAATYAATGAKSIHCSVCDAIQEGSKVTIPKLKVKTTTISKVTAAKKGFTVKWKKGSGITGYEIQYGLKKNFSGARKVTLSKASTVTKKITKLKAKKKYFVRIRTYKVVSGKKYYSTWSKAKAVTTKK